MSTQPKAQVLVDIVVYSSQFPGHESALSHTLVMLDKVFAFNLLFLRALHDSTDTTNPCNAARYASSELIHVKM